jgi:hypothetical protein
VAREEKGLAKSKSIIIYSLHKGKTVKREYSFNASHNCRRSSLKFNSAINGASTQQFLLSSSDVTASTRSGRMNIIRRHTVLLKFIELSLKYEEQGVA